MKIYSSCLKNVIFGLCFIIPLIIKAQGDSKKVGIKFRSLTFEQAVLAAKAEKKPIYIHGFADWCHYCKYMKDSVYTDPEIAAFYNANFISLQIDYEKEGREMNRTLKIHTFPAMLYYDTNGELMHRAAGRKYKQPFLELGKEALDPNRQMRYFKKKYESATATPYEVQFYFRMLEIAGMDAQPLINTYLTKQPDSTFTDANNWRIMHDITKDAYLPVMKRVLENKKELEAKYTADSINNKLLNLYNTKLMQFVQKVDSVGYEAAKQKVRTTKGLDIAEKICAWADLNKLKMKSDWEAYKVEGKKFVEQYALNDVRRLNDVSQIYYERFNADKTALAEAEKWMLKSVSIADLYKGNHLLASISTLLGKKEQALKYAKRAVEVAMRDKNDYKPTTLLLEKIEAMQ